jgi:hypothetical protein
MTCKNGTQTAVHLEQASKIHVSPNYKVKLQKHTITSDNSLNLDAPPIYYLWSWDPLSMPADSLLDNSHFDFLLFKLCNHAQDMDAQCNNVTHMDDLLISTVTSPVSKFGVFIWITSIFVAISLAFKSIPYKKIGKFSNHFHLEIF